MGAVKIHDFFNRRFFEIPRYQRGYAWEKQNIRELFDDIIEAIQSKSDHYIGTIVLSKAVDSDNKYYVVDGQQRITTISLVINALLKHLKQNDSAYFERCYIKEGNRYRLTPLSRDRQYYINLMNNQASEPQNKSQRFLREAVEEINLRVSAIVDKLKFLESVEKLSVMQFVEESEGDAIRIFQTVNDRGKPLSNMEKAKSLLIYFSNRYLDGKLDDTINTCFSDIFEIYDDIKHTGEELNISLIKNKDFNEDNLMRYHFVTFSNENYDPSASYVLQFLKHNLTVLRNEAVNGNYSEIKKFIANYIDSLEQFFSACKSVIEKASTDAKYYKLFPILNLSATLYPLIIKLEMRGILDNGLPSGAHCQYTFLDLVELIDVRVYKTRATDPKADIARFVYAMDKEYKSDEKVEEWMLWFNHYWMNKDQFQSSLHGNVYGNRALSHIFISYSEKLKGTLFTIAELQNIVSRTPSIEHILAQTPNFGVRALGFKTTEDFLAHEHTLGNLTVLEKSLNSGVQNKNPRDKVDTYDKSIFIMTKKVGSDIYSKKGFTKPAIVERTEELAEYCAERWWC